MNYDASNNADYVQYEARFVGGDSGAPMFVEYFNTAKQQQDLLLLGTNAFIEDDGSLSGINYIGNQAGFVNNFISISAVPEPCSVTLVIGTFVLFAMRRARPFNVHCLKRICE